MAENWSLAENEATVAAYFAMFERELRGETYNKSEARRRLQAQLDGRSEGAIERKHQNISAILLEHDLPYIVGYKPLSNYQQSLEEVVQRFLSPALLHVVRERIDAPLPSVPRDGLPRLVAPPEPRPVQQRRRVLRDLPRPRRITNYLEMEARRRDLGAAGEELVLRMEIERLRRDGEKKLADRVQQVSDLDGYDIHSFEAGGQDRLIEVKTTTFGAHTPFFVSRNEVEVSWERQDRYFVYRLFEFRDDPQLFIMPGAIGRSFSLEAMQFVARLT